MGFCRMRIEETKPLRVDNPTKKAVTYYDRKRLSQDKYLRRTPQIYVHACRDISEYPVSQPACKLKTDTKNTGVEIPLSQYERIASALEEGLRMNRRPSWQKGRYKSPELPLYNKC